MTRGKRPGQPNTHCGGWIVPPPGVTGNRIVCNQPRLTCTCPGLAGVVHLGRHRSAWAYLDGYGPVTVEWDDTGYLALILNPGEPR